MSARTKLVLWRGWSVGGSLIVGAWSAAVDQPWWPDFLVLLSAWALACACIAARLPIERWQDEGK